MYNKSLFMFRGHSHNKLTYNSIKKWGWFFHQLSVLRKSHTTYFAPLYWRPTVRCSDDWYSLHFFLAVAHCYANRELDRPLLWNPFRTIIRTTFRTNFSNDYTNARQDVESIIRTKFSTHSKPMPMSYESESQRSGRCWSSQSASPQIGSPGHDNESHVVGRPT